MNFQEKIKGCTRTQCSWCFDLQCEGANINMAIDDEAKEIPSVFISKQYSEALRRGNYKIVLMVRWIIVPSDVANQLSDFQVGGDFDGQLKPDVTAPGGNIYSSFNDNTYGSISGTVWRLLTLRVLQFWLRNTLQNTIRSDS